jgi:hypothetical protein
VPVPYHKVHPEYFFTARVAIGAWKNKGEAVGALLIRKPECMIDPDVAFSAGMPQPQEGRVSFAPADDTSFN